MRPEPQLLSTRVARVLDFLARLVTGLEGLLVVGNPASGAPEQRLLDQLIRDVPTPHESIA